jgi:hydrogenase maturation protease
MNQELVEKIANAVLYEGYILYPYRASAVKNRQRWNFGALYPRAFSLAQGQAVAGVDAWTMQTECLVSATRNTTFDVRVRFLHLLEREVNQLTGLVRAEASYQRVEMLEVNGQLYQSWQEAVERDVRIANDGFLPALI